MLVTTAAPADEPDDWDSHELDPALDYITEHELRDRGLEPAAICTAAPFATQLRALDGSRCWSRLDLQNLLTEGE